LKGEKTRLKMSSGTLQHTNAPPADIHKAIRHPGNVHINVQGAFIVDGAVTPPAEKVLNPTDRLADRPGDWVREDKDIRLPNQQSVVSHMAVDVSVSLAVFLGWASEMVENGARVVVKR
jgi:type II pantothenate kinase